MLYSILYYTILCKFKFYGYHNTVNNVIRKDYDYKARPRVFFVPFVLSRRWFSFSLYPISKHLTVWFCTLSSSKWQNPCKFLLAVDAKFHY